MRQRAETARPGGTARTYAFASLPPTARRLLEAAHRILERDGFDGLTLRRIAAEAGETKSLIIYHFDSKAGLVAHLVDFLWHDADVALRERVERAQAEPRERLEALIDLHERLALDTGAYRLYFELLPQVAGDEETRSRVVEFYRAYRVFGRDCVASAAPGLASAEPLAAALLAIGEGVPVQTLLLDDPVPVPAVFGLMRAAARAYLGVPGDGGTESWGWRDVYGGGEGPGAPLDVAGHAPPRAPELPPLGPRHDRPVADPTADLSPVAARVLHAAGAVLRRDGLRGLTLDAVAQESGEPRSSVSYHLGDKHAMIVRVVDLVNHETQAGIAGGPPEGGRQARSLAAHARSTVLDRDGRRAFFELLPAVLRDPELKAREAAFVDWILARLAAEVGADGTAPGSEPVLAAASLALVHGLWMQALVEPDTFDPTAPLDAWMAALRAWSTGGGLPVS